MKNLKIGLLIDNINLDDLNSEIVSTIEKNNFFKIDAIIINKKVDKKSRFFFLIKKYSIFRIVGKIIFKLVFLFEKNFLYKFFENYKFSKTNLGKIEYKKIFVDKIISKNGFFTSYSDSDLEKINDRKLDVIVKMDNGILKGKILDLPKFGILSYNHGDHDINRAGPPGFWEVYFKMPTTGFVIQKLNSNLDGGEILFKGHVPTKNFYYQNQKFVYKQSAKYIENVLEKIFNQYNLIRENKTYYNKVFKDPNIIQIFNYIIVTYFTIIYKIVRKLFLKKDIWNVAFKKCKFNEYGLGQYNIIENKNKNRFIADPFLFKEKNINYLFVEDYCFKKKRGAISCYKLNENKNFFLGKVLEEDFHLSFPFIFKYEDEVYMCPETYEKREIRLYQCLEFPTKWKYKITLMKNIYAVDTLIFEKDKVWWMLTNTDKNEIDPSSELSIFYSKESPITDKWIAHKSNPIYVDSSRARNGGIIFDDSNIFRVNQKIGFNIYGEKFDVNKILNINENIYEEKLFLEVKPNFFNHIYGTHHMNNNEDFTAFDFVKRNYIFTGKNKFK